MSLEAFLIKMDLFSSYAYKFFPALLYEVSSHMLLYSLVSEVLKVIGCHYARWGNPKTFFRMK